MDIYVIKMIECWGIFFKETLKQSTFEDTTLRERKPVTSKGSEIIKSEKTSEEIVIPEYWKKCVDRLSHSDTLRREDWE